MNKKYILILCSEEGSSLVSFAGQYNRFFAQERMAHDVNIVSDVIFKNGYTPLVVSFHEDARYLKVSTRYKTYLDKNIALSNRLEVSKYVNEIAGIALVGVPGKSGSGAFIDGTNNKLGWHDYLINHKTVSEAELFATYFGNYNIPIIFASGCNITMGQDRKSFSDIPLVVTKKTINIDLAESLPEDEIDKLLKDKMQEAITKIDSFKPFKVNMPLTITIVFNRTDYCDDALQFSNYKFKRIDARTLEKQIDSFSSINDFLY